MDKTFILHFGPQKTGTTWLHTLSIEQPWFAAPMYKEPRILNWIDDCERGLNVSDTKGVKYLKNFGFDTDDWIQNYVDYYCDILKKQDVTMDCSCSNYDLKRETIKKVIAEFAKRNVRVVGILNLREPVARLNSLVRMYFIEMSLNEMEKNHKTFIKNVVNSEKIMSGQWGPIEEYEGMCSWFRTQDLHIKNVYEKIKHCLGDNVEFIVFENLFNGGEDVRLSELKKIENLIGKTFENVNWDPVNTTTIKNRISKEIDINNIMNLYKNHYNEVREIFGESITKTWNDYRKKLEFPVEYRKDL